MQTTVSPLLTFRRRFLALALSLAAALMLLTAAAASARAAGDDRVYFPNSLKVESAAARAAMATPQPLGATDTVEFQIVLRMRDFAKAQARVAAGERIPQAEMTARYYPLESDYLAVVKWAREQRLVVLNNDPLHLTVVVSGPATVAEKALATRYAHVAVAGQDYLAAQSLPSLPASVGAPVLSINGLQPYLQVKRLGSVKPQTRNAPPYLISEILRAYNATNLGVSGAGQTIAILIDTFPLDSDLTAFWSANSIPQTLANITKINVTNSSNLPAPTGEETLDVSWTSGVAPAAKISVYASGSLSFVNLDKSFQRIIQDLQGGATFRQLSISLGLGELDLPNGEATTESQYFLTITNFGVSVFVSSGDDGSNFGGDFGSTLQVSYAASDPSVTGVGGTALELDPVTGAATSETVWNDEEGAGGGGISALFARPSYQQGAGVPAGSKRLVPDVALAADPETGCYLIVNGKLQQSGGTSWSAPVWAGFSALINQARADNGLLSVGLLNPLVYPLLGTNNFRDIVAGSNGAYGAGPGYDLTTGVGVPVVNNLLATLVTGGRFTLTGFTPTSGPVGTTVTINGSRLDHTVGVSFNGAGANFTKVSSVQLTAVVPAGAATGPVTIVDDAGTAQTSSLPFTVLAPGAGLNDPFVNALALGVPPVSVTSSNVNATSEPGEPLHAGKPGGASIWYKVTPTVDGVYSFNTIGSGFDTLLAVYTGDSVSTLTEVTSNDDGAGLGTASSVAFQAFAGTTYYVAVDGINPEDGSGPAEGTVVLNFTNAQDRPVIADFNPQRGGLSRVVRIFGGNFLAVNSVRFNGTAAAYVIDSNTQLTTAVPPGATTGPITLTDTSGNSVTSAGTFTVVAVPGNDLFVNGRLVEGATARLTGTNSGASKEPGEPDHAGNAGGESVWFTWTAPRDGVFTLNTVGSDFDTLLAVYTGSSVRTLTVVASNDDGGTLGTSLLAFNATAGTAYRFALDGYNGTDGTYTLNLQPANGTPTLTSVTPNTGGAGVGVALLGTGLTTVTGVKFNGVLAPDFRVDSDTQITVVVPDGATTGPVAVTGLNGTAVSPTNFTVIPTPGNDNFANSQPLVGSTPITVSGTNAGATKEAGEPPIIAGDKGGRSLWYTWTPPTSGDYVITTRGSDFDTILGVFTGTTLANLVPVVANDDDPAGGVTSSVTFTAVRGTAYRIAVDGAGGDAGSVTLSILTTTAIQDIYTTSFEPNEGYDIKLPLVGQAGWKAVQDLDGSNITGGNGLLANQFPNLGQQAYVGLTPLSNRAAFLQVYHDLSYLASASNPVVSFSTLMKITPSSNGHADRFGFTVGNAQGSSADEEDDERYFSLLFDNASHRIFYQLSTGAQVNTGVTFVNNATYTLQMTLDFQNNLWSATLNGATLADAKPINSQGPAQSLTRISADWGVAFPTTPGDNYMAFDQYALNAPAFSAPVITLQPSSQTVISGDAVLFSVVAAGTPPLQYQWFYQGQPIDGATMSTYSIPAATPSAAGRYTVQVRNAYGTTTSLDAFLVVSTSLAPVSSVVSVAAQQTEIVASAGQNGVFLLTRTGDLSQALTVDYSVRGSALPGVDYQAKDGRVTFKAGQAKKKVKIVPLDRGIRDGSTAKVTLKVLSGNGYTLGAPSKDKLRIQRN